jgi:hypothetical protein
VNVDSFEAISPTIGLTFHYCSPLETKAKIVESLKTIDKSSSCELHNNKNVETSLLHDVNDKWRSA